MRLITSDEYPAYPDAIRAAYGLTVTPPRTGRPGRPRTAYTALPPDLAYATVHKTRESGRVVDVTTRVVFGTAVAVALALALSVVSRVVSTCSVERHNGTDRNRCARKVRKGYTFSEDWDAHRAATRFRDFSLRPPGDGGRAVADADPGHGRGAGGSRVAAIGMARRSRCATQIGHHAIAGLVFFTHSSSTLSRPIGSYSSAESADASLVTAGLAPAEKTVAAWSSIGFFHAWTSLDVDLVMGGEFAERAVAREGGQGHLGLEGGRVNPRTFVHSMSPGR